jgi:iron complex outermembrane receptor protein
MASVRLPRLPRRRTPRFAATPRAFPWLAVVCLGSVAAGSSVAASSVAELKRLSLDELLEIEVTSVSRSPVPLAEAPSALQIVTSDEIRRSGATSIPQALRLAGNLNVARKNAHDWGVSARGFNTELANKMLVMIDGRTVYTPLFSGVRWDVQDYLLEDIERIEAISGPGGSLWGANAVNGVINITTKNARDTQGFYGEIGGGDPLDLVSGARYGGRLGDGAYFRIYGKRVERGSQALASGADAGDQSRFSQGGFRLDADTAGNGSVTLQGDYYLGNEGFVDGGDGKVAGGNVLGRWVQPLANGSDLQVQLYYDRTYLRQPVAAGPFSVAGSFTDDLETCDVDLQHTIPHRGDRLTVWGLAYRHIQDRTTDAPGLDFQPPEQAQDLFSGFVHEQLPLGHGFQLSAGTKIEHNDYTGLEIEPNIRLQRQFSGNRMLWAAVSRAVRTPSRIDRDIRQPAGPITILAGGSDFDSETVIAYEAGARAQLGARLIGSVSLFYNDYRDVRSLHATPVTLLPFVFGNDLEGESHGAELALSYDVLAWWRLRATYTRLDTRLRVKPGGVDLNNALNETSDPENQFALLSSMDLPHGFELDGQLRWVDTLVNNNNGAPGTVPGYVELNVRLGLRVNDQWDLSLVGQNLLDAQHPEFGLAGPNRVEIRRSVFGKLSWRY